VVNEVSVPRAAPEAVKTSFAGLSEGEPNIVRFYDQFADALAQAECAIEQARNGGSASTS